MENFISKSSFFRKCCCKIQRIWKIVRVHEKGDTIKSDFSCDKLIISSVQQISKQIWSKHTSDTALIITQWMFYHVVITYQLFADVIFGICQKQSYHRISITSYDASILLVLACNNYASCILWYFLTKVNRESFRLCNLIWRSKYEIFFGEYIF